MLNYLCAYFYSLTSKATMRESIILIEGIDPLVLYSFNTGRYTPKGGFRACKNHKYSGLDKQYCSYQL